jgi:adenylosuccinate lyase
MLIVTLRCRVGMTLTPLTALSPVDGRYAAKLDALRANFSEAGLITRRIRVEAAWILYLGRHAAIPALQALSKSASLTLTHLATEPPPDAAEAVKSIERRINHDAKAVEYYVREQLLAANAAASVLGYVHFGCTSEDINNLSYALLVRDARAQVLLPAIDRIVQSLRQLAHEHAAVPMLARTHGQPASPTTLGKEIANFVARVERQRTATDRIEILGKWNGATGNYNAHRIAHPGGDWPGIARGFVESLGLSWNPYTTQIEPHDWTAEFCDAIARTNTILIGLCRDLWGYIALGYFRQRVIEGEVGSSTMPHKVNPIDFENAEGNFGVANALLRHLAEKLPISRWQRDLSDSTVMRNLGVALGHTAVAFDSVARGLAKLQADPERIASDLAGAWEVLTEALQTVMRSHGIADAYEQLKGMARGREVTQAALLAFIATLPLPPAEKQRLSQLTPANYTGYAADLARRI